jgi:nitrate/nitrite-specific signal transduction histidine kinase
VESTVTLEEMRRLLDAVVDVGAGLDLPSILRRVVEAATDLAGAEYGALGVLDPTGTRLDDFITVGVTDDVRGRIGDLPHGHGILGLIIDGDQPVRLDDLRRHPDRFGFPKGHPPMRTFLGVPIRIRDRTFGDLYLTEKRGGGAFTDADEELVEGLAAAAGVAIENARLHDRVGRLALADDRARIGRDLHDTVIQRLFATGLALQGAQVLCQGDPAEAARRIGAAVDDLDLTVKHIRSVIFGLDATRRGEAGLRDRVLSLCHEAAGPLGFTPGVAFEGPVDTLVPEHVEGDLLATLREALANAARHARARSVDVRLLATIGQVELTVCDDGVGGAATRAGGRGLRNMQTRASRLGGTCAVEDRPDGGTCLHWSVPIEPPDQVAPEPPVTPLPG